MKEAAAGILPLCVRGAVLNVSPLRSTTEDTGRSRGPSRPAETYGVPVLDEGEHHVDPF